MTVVNPKSISGINSITTGSGSDNLLTIHTSDASSTERVRINSSGDVIVGSGITVSPDGDVFTTGVTTATTFVGALTGNVTGNISGGTVAGSTGTFTGDVDIADTIVHTGDTNTKIRFPAADTVTVETSGSERLRIDSSGRLLLGTTTEGVANASNFTIAGAVHCGMTIRSGTSNDGQIAFSDGTSGDDEYRGQILYRHSSDHMHFVTNATERVRIFSNGDIGVNATTVNRASTSRNTIQFDYSGSDGREGLEIRLSNSALNGNAATDNAAITYIGQNLGITNRENGLISFRNNGSERVRIDANGLVSLGDAISGMDMGFGNQMFNSKSGTYSAQCLGSTSASVTTSIIYNSNTSFGGSVSMCDWRAAASNSSAWYFLRLSTSSASDNEFFLAGDGNAYADGSWSGGGADYAEYYEWSEGNTSDEDRRGMTVVLDGTKIKIATSSDSADNIIGVVSGNPAMIADTAYCKWSGKYQRDDYNAYVRDSEGHRVLNSDYDDTKTYLPRKDRKEWDAIGMVGKLRVRKGQQTGTRWIKMKDVSDTIEGWLVR